MNRSAAKPLPDEPWPLSARNLLSRSENKLYNNLIAMYPDHKIFVQVALSQLISVDKTHPDCAAIRARYKQLVADFVLCRPDLSLVAVIELDDRTHEWPKRQAADARKNKALADAGIKLVRVPAGRLPSQDTLRALIDANGMAAGKPHGDTVLSLAEAAGTYSADSPEDRRDRSSAKSNELKPVALKAAAVAVLLFGGWFILGQGLPAALQKALQPLAVPQTRAASLSKSMPIALPQIPTAPVNSGPTAEELAAQKPRLQTENELQKQEDRAWAAFYTTPASCEHPADWSAQVECGNQYMRVKRLFEKQWAVKHPSQGSRAAVVLDNASVAGINR